MKVRPIQDSGASFASCRNGRFAHNLSAFRRSDLRAYVNIGPDTAAERFRPAALAFRQSAPVAQGQLAKDTLGRRAGK